MKVAAIVQLGILAAEIIADQALPHSRFGASEAAIPIETEVTSQIVDQIIKQAVNQVEQQLIQAVEGPTSTHWTVWHRRWPDSCSVTPSARTAASTSTRSVRPRRPVSTRAYRIPNSNSAVWSASVAASLLPGPRANKRNGG